MTGVKNILETTTHSATAPFLSFNLTWREKILYFGKWEVVTKGEENCHRSNAQYHAFEFSFKGSTVKWIGSKGEDQGYADVFIDGEFQQTVDGYSRTIQNAVIKFEKAGLSDGRKHTLRVVVRKDRNPDATDCYQDVTSIQAVTPVVYPAEIAQAMTLEYKAIQSASKTYLSPDTWFPVKDGATPPGSGVILEPGLLNDTFKRNIDYLNYCFASPTYCDGTRWPEWLPASNEGRMLAGAGNTLRWEERTDMRNIVNTIVDTIEERMRDDGYYNYYDERDSYALISGANSERKNYDRVFWTRGLLAAGMVGNPKAYDLLRRMYDWFNDSPYLPEILIGGNATNGLPGGPLMYLSPAGKEDDLIVTQKYYDQDYWMVELSNREPLCLSHYPGERPHCYDLLGFESFVDEYRATGAEKYIDAVIGGWEIYKNNYKHIGGATAIMESPEVYPPKSYYFATKKMGEACGSVFWIYVNSRLLGLFPTEEKYAAEIEESLYNVIMAAQDRRGYIRYHNLLEGNKVDPVCENTCCEVATSGLIARLPEYIYSTADDGLYVNLYTASSITWKQDGDEVTLNTTTNFPFDPEVSMKLSMTSSIQMNVRIRVPSWARGEMTIEVNGSDYASGTPGTYLSLERKWSENDTINFTLPIGFTPVKYTGLDQIEGNYDRYALMYGPILMALQGNLSGLSGVPQLAVTPDELPGLLAPKGENPLEYNITGYSEYKYMPYWKIEDETFTCFPIVQR